MEEYLTKPLPTLSVVREEGLPVDDGQQTFKSLAFGEEASNSPSTEDDMTTLVIQWQAANLLSRVDPDALKGMLSKIPGASHKIGEIPIIKSYTNLLLLLHEEDSEKQWITRIPYDQEDRKFLIDEVEPLMRVAKRFTGFRVPRLYQYGLAKDQKNRLAVDYMILDFIDGRQMPMWTENYPAWEQKEQILEQLADIYIEWFSKPATYDDRLVLTNANCVDGTSSEDFDSFDLPPTMTASMYLHQIADASIRGKFQRLLAEDAAEISKAKHKTLEDRFADLLRLFLMRGLIATQVIGEYNDASFYITHPDLHNRNIVINAKPAYDGKSRPVRTKHFCKSATSASSSPKPGFRKRAMSTSSGGPKLPPIKIAGIIDWDSAHPIPLQCAAIYPKFIETLPGAEFPDLPPGYKTPDMEPEKEFFLDIFSRKEFKTTGDQVVTDLIRYGSKDRDFFTTALQRGNIRAKWFEHRYGNRANKPYLHAQEFNLEDARLMWDGLQGFLSHERNWRAVNQHGGWYLVLNVLLQLESLEELETERLWVNSVSVKRRTNMGRLNGCMI